MTSEVAIRSESTWNLPSHWGIRELGSVAKEVSRQVKPSDDPSQTYNYWGLDAIAKGQFEEPDPNLVLGSSIDSTCVEFNTSQILYSKLRPYLNKVIVPSVSGIGTTEWVVIQPDPEVVDRSYLAYVLRSHTFVSYASQARNTTGARMPRLRKEALWRFEIPLPYPDDPTVSLRVQRAILARAESLLEELREICELHAAIDHDVGIVMESVLYETFDDIIQRYPSNKRIDAFTKVRSGGTPDRSRPEYYNGSIPWVKTGELKDGFIYDAEEHITEEATRNSNAKKFPPGTLLIAMYGQGQTRGRTGLLAIEATTNQACCAILPNDDVFAPRFLQYWFVFMYRELRKRSEARGGNQSNLNAGMIKELKPPLPDVDVQKQVISYLDGIRNEIEEMIAVQATDDQLFAQVEQSILEQAFRGEL